MKKCKECNITKLKTEFYGVQGECKSCTKKRVSENYQKNKSHYSQYEVKRNKTEKRKKQILESQRKQRERNPEKYLARQKVLRALKKGILIKQPCKVCSKTNVEAHHEDHNYPLNVIWLCRQHHLEADRLLKQNEN